GLIRSIHFEEGRRVKKDDLILKIDDSELLAQLAQSMSHHQLARLNLTRAENLRQTQSNTAADVDRARSEFAAPEADIELFKVRLARTEVKAPFDGVIEARTLSPGDYLNAQSIITTINDLSRLKVEFQVPERYIGKIRQGTKFTVKSTTAGEEAAVDGEVLEGRNAFDAAYEASSVRFRPILMTSISTVLGAVPIALPPAPGRRRAIRWASSWWWPHDRNVPHVVCRPDCICADGSPVCEGDRPFERPRLDPRS
ncbi:MAG: efflux RND transporter periplasmic adaptor subunit, partial [Opitutaceae bacterium]